MLTYILFQIGVIFCIKLHDITKAQRILNHISDHNWSSLESEYYEMLGDIFLHLGDEDKAESHYLKAIEEIT